LVSQTHTGGYLRRCATLALIDGISFTAMAILRRRITAEFANSGSIVVYLYGADAIFIVVRDSNDQMIQSAPQSRHLNFPHINILPQLVPVADAEERLNETYVHRSLSTARSSIHFRNELLVLREYYEEFKSLCEDNWPRLQIRELLTGRGERRNELELHIRDEDFVGEVRWMGHGLQIWLQTMWFLARVARDDVVVLDEPDVFLHADLQRKLIRILKSQDRQSIIATHSIEMMAEVNPSSILVVDRRRRRSQFATSLPAVQEIIDHIGGVHNIQLARLWSHRKIIYVEGDDISLLKIFQDKLFPMSNEPLDVLPNFSIGGWGGWSQVIGSSVTLRSGGGESIAKYCILDRDYHTNHEIAEREASALAHNISLHIWTKKEIENYVILPRTIERYINTRKRKGSMISLVGVEQKLNEICEDLKDKTLDLISQQYNYAHRPKNSSDGNRYARGQLRDRWTSLSGKLGTVSGKDAISQISEWTQLKLWHRH
jgi:energy-coupling factor transporter ATP-binding protein EcfA2